MPANLLTTLICDDVRQEVANKLTLVGLYASNITFASTQPNTKLVLPKMAIVQRWRVDEDGHKVQIDIVDPEGKTGASTQYTIPFKSSRNYHTNVWYILGAGFKPGTYTIRTFLDGKVHEDLQIDVQAVPRPSGA